MGFFKRFFLLYFVLLLPSLTSFPVRLGPVQNIKELSYLTQKFHPKTSNRKISFRRVFDASSHTTSKKRIFKSLATRRFIPFVHDVSTVERLISNQNLPKVVLRQGLNLEPCSSVSDCRGNRICVPLYSETGVPEPCDVEDFHCFCLSADASCNASSECDDGEVCFDLEESIVHLCISEQIAKNLNGSALNTEDPENVSSPVENGIDVNDSVSVENGFEHNTSSVDGTGSVFDSGLNGDVCSSESDCEGDRLCFLTSASLFPEFCPSESSDCFCFQPSGADCATDSDCDDGEVCFDEPDTVLNLCYSKTYALKKYISAVENGDSGHGANESYEPESTVAVGSGDMASIVPTSSFEMESITPSTKECNTPDDCKTGEKCVKSGEHFICIRPKEQEEGNVSSSACIAVHHLSGMRRGEMMYSKHVLARVLCDKHNNCGTHGHIVIYKGKPMMMSSYCDIEKCSQNISEVNSPKYVRRKLIVSNSDGLVFTCLAARHNSRLEETLLAWGVRVGL